MKLFIDHFVALLRASGLLTPHCELSIANENYFDSVCVKQFINRCLNVGIIAGSLFLQLPQIVVILLSKSVLGLSEMTFIMQSFAGFLYILYNVLEGIPFGTWGESLFVVLQNWILIILCWIYGKTTPSIIWIISVITTFGATAAFSFSDFAPPSFRPLLGLAPTFFVVVGRLPQIVQNIKQSHTGKLSLISYGLALLGNCGRIVTTREQTTDVVIFATHLISGILNAIIVFQVLLYWNKTVEITKRQPEKKLK